MKEDEYALHNKGEGFRKEEVFMWRGGGWRKERKMREAGIDGK